MRGRFDDLRSVRGLVTVVALGLAWCGLWGELSLPNLLVGLVLGAGITASGVGTHGRGPIRPGPALQLLWLVLVDLVTSTINVATEVATPNDDTTEGIIAVTVPAEAREHLLLLIVAVTLTPGTAVVDADPDTGVLYLHLLHLERREETVAHVAELARLACAALPIPKPDRTIGVSP